MGRNRRIVILGVRSVDAHRKKVEFSLRHVKDAVVLNHASGIELSALAARRIAQMGDVGIAVNRYLGLFAVEAVELIANPGGSGRNRCSGDDALAVDVDGQA